jgi:hypothetical protein
MRTGRHSISRFLLAAVSLACCCGADTWTDRSEYDLVLGIRSEAAPDRRIALLDQWKQKYPQSALAQYRREMYLFAYQAMGSWSGMLAVAREILAEQPADFVGLYWATVLTPGVKDPDAAALQAGEAAARQLLSGSSEFLKTNAPAGTPKQEEELAFGAHRTLGWIAWQRAAYDVAEQEFTTCLRQNPGAAEISSWYGTVLALQKQPEKFAAALWHWAHAVAVQGDSALSRNSRREMETLLEQMYTGYHGGPDGLAELRAAAAAAPFPPTGFQIETAAVLAARRQEEEFNRANPELAAWLRIRKRLDAPDGEAFFDQTLSAAPLPKLKGTLISFTPSRRPAKLVLGLKDALTEEVVLELDTAFPNQAEPGLVLEFEGTATAFAREPFRVTIRVERTKISGWPSP